MGCAKDGDMSGFKSSKATRAEYIKGLEISEYEDPFENPANLVERWIHEKTGQINQKIVAGPDKGVHRFYDPKTERSGQTGITRFTKGGNEYRQKEGK